MDRALDILVEIEGCSKEALEIIKNEQFQLLEPVLDHRQELISLLETAYSIDLESEKSILHRIEKLESKMLEILKASAKDTKCSINTVSKGKKAVKNGYFKSKMDLEKNNRFSKRG
ncbi:MAG: hypothetical protein ACOC4J_01275 [Bacteroidota bacterium]